MAGGRQLLDERRVLRGDGAEQKERRPAVVPRERLEQVIEPSMKAPLGASLLLRRNRNSMKPVFDVYGKGVSHHDITTGGGLLRRSIQTTPTRGLARGQPPAARR